MMMMRQEDDYPFYIFLYKLINEICCYLVENFIILLRFVTEYRIRKKQFQRPTQANIAVKFRSKSSQMLYITATKTIGFIKQ